MTPEPGMRTSTAVVAFRTWEVRRGRLHGLSAAQEWTGGVADARCERAHPGRMPHLAPAPGCTCGVHAVDSLATLARYMRWHEWGQRLLSPNRVTGAVLIWGAPGRKVLVGEMKGGPGLQFRAPHAQVLALADSRLARKVGARLGVPVVPREGLELYAREHGVQLRPERAAAKERPAAAAPRAADPDLGTALKVIAKAICRLVWAIVRGAAFVAWTALCCLGYSLAWLTPRVFSNPIGALVWMVAFVGAVVGLLVAVDALVVAPLLHLARGR